MELSHLNKKSCTLQNIHLDVFVHGARSVVNASLVSEKWKTWWRGLRNAHLPTGIRSHTAISNLLNKMNPNDFCQTFSLKPSLLSSMINVLCRKRHPLVKQLALSLACVLIHFNCCKIALHRCPPSLRPCLVTRSSKTKPRSFHMINSSIQTARK